jgi:hypothetical protein
LELHTNGLRNRLIKHMPSIKEKTPGQLVDELITNSLRCWFAQEKIQDLSLSDAERLRYAELAQQHNSRRTDLIRAIDELLGFSLYSNPTKSYKDNST